MIKRLVNSALKTILDELFVDVSKDAARLDLMGADIFSESKLQLSNLTFRPDLFNVFLQPLKLICGHIANVEVT
jgi:hypothetical protein